MPKGPSSRGTPLSLGWWAVSSPQASAAKSRLTAMRNACKTAGIANYSPHDLRHRFISVKIREGVPVTQVAAHVGHSRKSLTLDTYAHVLIDD
jgi:integrase